MEKKYEKVIEEINKIRQYKKPTSSSKTPTQWLDEMEENKNGKNKYVSSTLLLNNLRALKYIIPNQNGIGDVPTKESLKKGLFEVNENYRTSVNNENGLVQMCTIMLTEKGMNMLKNNVLALIQMKKNKLDIK